jgi:hypothetical protein
LAPPFRVGIGDGNFVGQARWRSNKLFQHIQKKTRKRERSIIFTRA